VNENYDFLEVSKKFEKLISSPEIKVRDVLQKFAAVEVIHNYLDGDIMRKFLSINQARSKLQKTDIQIYQYFLDHYF
jgi:hypothetical protein